MKINKNKTMILNKKTASRTRVGLTVLSALVLSSCGDASLPPILGGSPKREAAINYEQNQNAQIEAATKANEIPRAFPNNVNNKNLFGQNIRSDGDRLDRLERSVQSLRNDFDTVQPSIRRLMAIESDIQELIGELRQLSEEPSMAQPMTAPAPVTQTYRQPEPVKKTRASKKKSYQKKSAPAVQGGMATIYDVRSGEHPGKTRMVLDVNTKTSYNVDIDNNENIMVIDLPNTNWTAATSKAFPKSSVISSYNVEKSDAGNLMIIQLKKNARIGYEATLPSNSGSGKRIVLDIVAQ